MPPGLQAPPIPPQHPQILPREALVISLADPCCLGRSGKASPQKLHSGQLQRQDRPARLRPAERDGGTGVTLGAVGVLGGAGLPRERFLGGCVGRPWEAGAGVEPWPSSEYSLGSGAGAFSELFPHSWPCGSSRALASRGRRHCERTHCLLPISLGHWGLACGPPSPVDPRVLAQATSCSGMGTLMYLIQMLTNTGSRAPEAVPGAGVGAGCAGRDRAEISGLGLAPSPRLSTP